MNLVLGSLATLLVYMLVEHPVVLAVAVLVLLLNESRRLDR